MRKQQQIFRATGYDKPRRNMVKKVPRIRYQGIGWIFLDGEEIQLKDVWEGKREIRYEKRGAREAIWWPHM